MPRDETDFKHFYDKNFDRIWSLVRRLGVGHAAEDICQNAFLKAWKYRHQFKHNSSERTWLTRIALNEAKDFLRSSSRQKQEEFVENQHASTSQPVSSDLSARYKRVLSRLSLEHREVLILSSIEEMSLIEISELLGVPEATVRSRLFHARKGFRLILEKEGGPT